MNRSSKHPVRARLNVEALESRELPSFSLAGLGGLASPPSTAQVSYLSATSWQPGYSGLYPGVGTTPGFMGPSIVLNHNQTLVRVRGRKGKAR